MFRDRVASLALVLGVLATTATAQIPGIPKIPGLGGVFGDLTKGLKIPGLDQIPGFQGGIEGYLNGDPLTTNIKNASDGLPFLDGFAPKRFVSMSTLKRTPEGTFVTKPGAYAAVLRTYCLHAGTYGPSKGNGYVNAPLRGKRAAIIEKLLRVDTAKFGPEGQHTMQGLIWAILSRGKYDSFSPTLRAMGDRTLSPEDRFELNGGVVALIPNDIKQKLFSKIDSKLQTIIDAQQRLQVLATMPKLPFAEMEKLAVLVGEPPADKNDRDIPPARWVLNEQGVFVRYHAIGYPHTRVDTYVPERFVVTSDAQGRIARIEGPKKTVLDIAYGDAVLKTGSKEFSGYAISSLKFSGPGGIDLKDPGWTFVGPAPRRGGVKANASFDGAPTRLEQSRARQAQIDDDVDSFDEDKKAKTRRGTPVHALNVLNLRDAAEGALFAAGKESQGNALKEFLTKASMAELSDWVTGKEPLAEAALTASLEPASAAFLPLAIGYAQDEPTPTFTPSTAVAVPAQTFRQRLGITTNVVDDEPFADIQQDDKPQTVTLFFGGAWDSRYQYVQKYEMKIQGFRPNSICKYFGWGNSSEALEYIATLPEGTRINLVGHSYGGDDAGIVAARSPLKVNLLITVDPVSRFGVGSSFGPSYADVKGNTATWWNIMATAGGATSDGVAGVGGAWDEGPKGFADRFIPMKLHHADFLEMITKSGAHDLLLSNIEVGSPTTQAGVFGGDSVTTESIWSTPLRQLIFCQARWLSLHATSQPKKKSPPKTAISGPQTCLDIPFCPPRLRDD